MFTREGKVNLRSRPPPSPPPPPPKVKKSVCPDGSLDAALRFGY